VNPLINNMLFLDIETCPNANMVKYLPKPVLHKGLKDPVKIAADIEAKRDAQVAKMALSPLTGRVCVAATVRGATNDAPDSIIAMKVCDEEEKKVIRWAFAKIASVDNVVLVTYKGKRFDLPFLFKRAAILGMRDRDRPPSMCALPYYCKRYANAPHWDLVDVFSDDRTMHSLRMVECSMFGNRVAKDSLDVTQTGSLMATKEGRERLRTHCMNDVEALRRIALRCADWLF